VSVLVDTARFPAHGRWWAHLASDTSTAELHEFAARLGVPRRAFEGDHYDVPAELVEAAVAAGAQLVPTRELLRRLQSAGLRTPKRRGEKVLATGVEDGRRVDVVRAGAVPLPHGTHYRVRADGGLEVTARLTGRVLGFRRRWTRTATGTVVVHDGVCAPHDGAPHRPAPAGGADGWWSPLLAPEA
jgi:Protein of unknown function (DUF4031)